MNDITLHPEELASYLPAHSLAKVQLLGRYLEAFLSVIANDRYTERIRVYDLFCGEGIYADGGEGSPIVISRAIKELWHSRLVNLPVKPAIDCYFNDVDPDKVGKLQKAIESEQLHNAAIGNIDFSTRSYVEIIADLIAAPVIRNEKIFVFIDPFGYKHIRASDIRSLMAKGNAEVLLFLPTQFMYRFDANGTPVALVDFISDLVALSRWKLNQSVWDFICQLKASFREYLGSGMFVDTFTIQKDPQTVFCLFFFSSHILGFEKLLAAKWALDTERGKGWNYQSSQQASLLSNLVTHPLEVLLRDFMRGHPRTNAELYEFTLQSEYLPKHTNEVLRSLQKNNELTVVGPDGTRIRQGSFYVNYRDYRDEPNKVRFIIK